MHIVSGISLADIGKHLFKKESDSPEKNEE